MFNSRAETLWNRTVVPPEFKNRKINISSLKTIVYKRASIGDAPFNIKKQTQEFIEKVLYIKSQRNSKKL